MFRHIQCRLIFAAVVITCAAATLGMAGLADAQSGKQNVPGSHTSLSPIKQIDAGLLNVGYVELGPADGTAVILLHGWPYDINSYVDAAP